MLGVEAVHSCQRVGARGADDGLAFQIVQRLQVVRFFGDEFRRHDERRHAESDLGLAFGVVDRRTAFDVDGAVRDERDPCCGGHRVVLDLQRRQLELGLHRIGDTEAEVHRITDRLLFVVEIRERHRCIAMTERDLAAFLDLLQHAGQFLSDGGGADERKYQWNRNAGVANVAGLHDILLVRGGP